MADVAFRVTVAEGDEDQASGILWELGTMGIEVLRAPEGRALLLAYFAERPGLADALGAALAPLGGRLEAAAIPEVDWVARFRETFRGFRVGRFHVSPAWEQPPALRHDERCIRVDPGRAFGTGSHESTRLCLAEIEAVFAERTPRRVLDIGTGTGILAIATALLGASFVVGADNDAEALEAARQHGRLNAVRLSLVRCDAGACLRPGAFDLVLANITAPLLCARAPEIGALVAHGGVLVLAGLLADEARSVRAAYAGLMPAGERRDGDWSALRFTTA